MKPDQPNARFQENVSARIEPPIPEGPGEAQDSRPLGSILREVSVGIQDVIRSELQLARAELKMTGGRVARDGAFFGIAGLFAALGILPFIAFLVVGLGQLLGDNYWLSSLIVSLLFFAVGGAVAYLSYRKLRTQDVRMPKTREGLDQPLEALDRKIHRLADLAAKRRTI